MTSLFLAVVPLLLSILLAGSDNNLASAQLLPGLAADVSELSTFFQLLNSTPTLYNRIRQGGVTVLAPTNKAFTTFLNSSSGKAVTTDVGQLEALLQYHTVQGHLPGASLAGSASFLQTLLQNTSYTNVTSSQVVEAKGVNGKASLVSGLWDTSSVVTSDLFFQDGLIHAIDTVLSIPLQVAQTITAANLTYYVALGEKTGLVAPQSLPFVAGIQQWPNVTVFAPNSPQYSTNFTGWDNLNTDECLRLYRYHLINGSALYSANLTDGATFQTSLGLNVTVHVVNGDTYINDAKVSNPDLLTANGVIQVLDRPLDPNNTDARPQSSTTSTSTGSSAYSSNGNKSSELSTAAKAGIAAGVVIVVVALAGMLLWLAIRSRRNTLQRRERKLPPLEKDPAEMGTKFNARELPARYSLRELPAYGYRSELEGRQVPYELQ